MLARRGRRVQRVVRGDRSERVRGRLRQRDGYGSKMRVSSEKREGGSGHGCGCQERVE